jgi:hypothetical protein
MLKVNATPLMNHNKMMTIKSTSGCINDIILFDCLGKEMNHWNGKEVNEVTIPVFNFIQGTYFLKINGFKGAKIILI